MGRSGHILRVTERALVNDLLIDSSLSRLDAREILTVLVDEEIRKQPEDVTRRDLRSLSERAVRDRFPVLVKFVEMRSVNPVGQEPTKGLTNSRGHVWNLHAGEYRGCTWFDRDRGTVWLCASGFHRSGDRDDFYPRVVQLDAEHELLPTAEEVQQPLRDDVPEIVEEIETRLPAVVRNALQSPGSETRVVIQGSARLAVVAEVIVVGSTHTGEVYIGVKQLRPDLGIDLLSAVIAIAFPNREIGTDVLFRDSFPASSRNPDEGERIVSCVM